MFVSLEGASCWFCVLRVFTACAFVCCDKRALRRASLRVAAGFMVAVSSVRVHMASLVFPMCVLGFSFLCFCCAAPRFCGLGSDPSDEW